MAASAELFITGEFKRVVDDRFRISLPPELAEPVTDEAGDCVLTKERAGCLSLWRAGDWQARFDAGVGLIKQSLRQNCETLSHTALTPSPGSDVTVTTPFSNPNPSNGPSSINKCPSRSM